MSKVTIRPITLADIQDAPNCASLLAGYADECAIPELAPHDPQFAQYAAMEQSGFMHFIGAYVADELVGLVALIVTTIPHFGKRIASTESFYVEPGHRKSGAGLALLREAQAMATEKGAIGLFISAPVGGALESLLPRVGYRQTNSMFFKGLA